MESASQTVDNFAVDYNKIIYIYIFKYSLKKLDLEYEHLDSGYWIKKNRFLVGDKPRELLHNMNNCLLHDEPHQLPSKQDV